MFATQVVVVSAIAQYVEGGGEHRCSYRKDGLLGAAAGFDAQEQSTQVAGLDAHCSPGGSYQGGLDPGADLAYAGGAALVDALVATRT